MRRPVITAEESYGLALCWDRMQTHLRPDSFLAKIINCVLDVTPNDYHVEARRRRGLVLGGIQEA